MNHKSNYSNYLLNIILCGVIISAINAGLFMIKPLLSKNIDTLGWSVSILWIIAFIMMFIFYIISKKSTAVELSEDALTYKQGMRSFEIKLSDITDIKDDGTNVVVMGQNNKELKTFKHKHYVDISFIKQSLPNQSRV